MHERARLHRAAVLAQIESAPGAKEVAVTFEIERGARMSAETPMTVRRHLLDLLEDPHSKLYDGVVTGAVARVEVGACACTRARGRARVVWRNARAKMGG